MVLFNAEGEKFACEQCIKGHRVSSCQHSDRPLQHVNKKGRPVSQCNHCRGLRKSRATHTRCHCGDAKAAPAGDSAAPLVDRSCGCHSGLKCTCALKKETNDIDDIKKMATMNNVHKRTPSKPSIASRRSESSVPKFKNAHTTPTHRINNAAIEQNWPYPARKSISHIHQRSVDSLQLDAFSSPQQQQGNANPSGLTITPPRNFRKTSYDSPIYPTPESASMQSPTYPQIDLSPIPQQRWSMNDVSSIAHSNVNTPALWSQPSGSSTGTDQGPFAWSEWDFSRTINHGNLAEQFPQPPSVESSELSHGSQPSLSPSKSGSVSESGDLPSNSGELGVSYANYPSGGSGMDSSWTFPNFADPESNHSRLRLSTSSLQFNGSDIMTPHSSYGLPNWDSYLNDFSGGKDAFHKEPVIAGLDGLPTLPHHQRFESTESVDPMTIHTFGGDSSWNSAPIWANYPYNNQNLSSPVFSPMEANAQHLW